MSFISDLGINLPSYQSGGLNSGLMYTLVGIVVFGVLAIVGYIWLDDRKYKYKIELFENLGGTRYVKTGTDRAKIVKLGDGGEEILWLKKRKVFRPAYGRKMGNNLLWFAIGQDGYWYNVTLGDLDAKQGMLDIEPIDRDMRYMHVAVRKNIQDRYKKTKFMDKYGTMILGGIFLIIMIAGIWFLLDKMADSAQVLSSTAQTTAQVMEGNRQVLTALDNLISGSGIRPVGG